MKLRVYAVVLTLLVAGLGAAFWQERVNSAMHAAQATKLSRQNAELSYQLKQVSKNAERYEQRALALDSQLGSAKTRTTATESKQVQLTRELHETKTQLSEREQREVALMTELATLRQKVAAAAPASASTDDEEAIVLPTLMVQPKLPAQPKTSTAAATRPPPESSAAPSPVVSTAPSADEIAAYNRRINELETQLTQLLTRALATHAEPTPAVAPVAETISYQVVRVGPRDSFVVLNYGAEKGAASGRIVSLQRDGVELARAQISDARPKFALAQVLTASLKGQLQTGDLVVFTN